MEDLYQNPYRRPQVPHKPANGVRRPTFIIKRPLVAQNQYYPPGDYQSFRSLPAHPNPLLRHHTETDQFIRPYNFVSIHRPYFDSCGRLWFIDTGSLEYKDEPVFYKKARPVGL